MPTTQVAISNHVSCHAVAEDLRQSIEAKGYKCWISSTPGAAKERGECLEHIRSAECVIVLIGDASRFSEWQEEDYQIAAIRQVLIPLQLADSQLPLWASTKRISISRLFGREFPDILSAISAVIGTPASPRAQILQPLESANLKLSVDQMIRHGRLLDQHIRDIVDSIRPERYWGRGYVSFWHTRDSDRGIERLSAGMSEAERRSVVSITTMIDKIRSGALYNREQLISAIEELQKAVDQYKGLYGFREFDYPERPKPKDEGPLVDCSVYGPAKLPSGYPFLIQVLFHTTGHALDVGEWAFAADEDSKLRQTISTSINDGEEVVAVLHIDDYRLEPQAVRFRWSGRPQHFNFLCSPTKGASKTLIDIFPRVSVSVGGRLVGEIVFKISFERIEIPTSTCLAGERVDDFGQIFVSYATEDAERAFDVARLCRVMGSRTFIDKSNLIAGTEWFDGLLDAIDASNTIILLWTADAKQSGWVQTEILYALHKADNQRGPRPRIIPIVPTGHKFVTPPRYLKHIHFDAYGPHFWPGPMSEPR